RPTAATSTERIRSGPTSVTRSSRSSSASSDGTCSSEPCLPDDPRPGHPLMLAHTQSVKPIPLVEPWFPESYADAVRDQVLSGFIGPGRATQEFAGALAQLVGAPRALLTVSGTVALSVAAHALGLAPGDEILVPAYGVISTINAFAAIGLRP